VLKLPARSNAQIQLPFTGLTGASEVAVDAAGNIYLTSPGGNHPRVLKLLAGSNTQVELPFTGLGMPNGVAVDTVGNVYVADFLNNQVLKLPAG
jgi:serine/threonine protein kinase, bacterial